MEAFKDGCESGTVGGASSWQRAQKKPDIHVTGTGRTSSPWRTPMTTATIPKPRAFSLRAASDFYAGFVPGSGMAAAALDGLTLAFRLDGTFDAVAVALREEGDTIVAEFAGTTDATSMTRQVARILGLDADGEAWSSMGRRDPVVGRLQAEFPGFFTAAKPSPYEAAVWGVIAPRMHIGAAAKLKMGIALEHGDAVELHGRTHHVFPSPTAVGRIERVAGLPDEKLARLKGIGRAALDGKLDAGRLRAMTESVALAELQALRGVGPWTASHIFYRGAAPHDALPTTEPRVLHGLAHAYGLESASQETLERLGERWRPFRMWVCVLLSRHLARAGGWNAPGLAKERAAAGRRLAARTRREPLRSSPLLRG
jgi:DNA-3-methyladenine glycosylase II